jgi:cobalt-zinc-cadmium efflux system membrane fusion protein
MNPAKVKLVAGATLAVVLIVGTLLLWQTGKLDHFFGAKAAHADSAPKQKYPKPDLIAANGEFGLKLSKEAIQSLELQPYTVETAREPIALPPMIGTVNYDNERLFAIKPRFTGEVAEVKEVDETREFIVNGSTTFKVCKRPLKFGDKVKQGDTMVVFWSQTLGQQKAAFVDAITGLRLSEGMLKRHKKLFDEAALSEATLRQSERQVELDGNAVLTAERTLRMWKLTDQEIKEIRDEANVIIDQKLPRDAKAEVKKWARVVVPVPIFDRDNMNRELTVVEKNTHMSDMIDPANYGTPLFKVADLSRLKIWANPPEEYLPILRERLNAGRGGLKWNIRFQSEPGSSKGLDLEVSDISHGLDPNQHTPLVFGYLDNKDGKYLIGQFVTATVLVAPPPDTVAIPTDAVNPLEGKDYVFVVKPGTDDQFLIRHVSVVMSGKKTTLVRSKLTPELEQANKKIDEEKKDAFKFEPLLPGERIVIRSVLELTAALEEARNAPAKTKEK